MHIKAHLDWYKAFHGMYEWCFCWGFYDAAVGFYNNALRNKKGVVRERYAELRSPKAEIDVKFF